MTTVSAPVYGTEIMAVLRPAQLDARDTAIVLAVAKCYADGCPASLHDVVMMSGVKMASLRFRISGVHHNSFFRKGGGLVARGWLCVEPGHDRTLRPGPRFGGMQRRTGVIYERIEA